MVDTIFADDGHVMCEPGEQVLSDVHVNHPSSRLLNEEQATTRFYFSIPKATTKLALSSKTQQDAPERNSSCTDKALWSGTEGSVGSVPHGPTVGDDGEPVTMATVDEDGDFVVARKRRRSNEENMIVIDHAMATTLNDVGLQVWQACLLLCDYLLTHQEMFSGQVALELGAGVGLGSIVMAMMASYVFCTDVGTNVLETCQRNISNNCLHDGTQGKSVLQVRELDWFKPTKKTNSSGSFQWVDKDWEKLKEVGVIFAADVVYDNDLTDAFFNTLSGLMALGKDKTAFIALEKRLNFTIDDLDLTCKAYDHYRRHITRLASSQDHPDVKYSVEQLPVDFPQCFQYKRTKQLELWQIKAVRRNMLPD